MITLLWKSSCLPMSEVYDDLLQKLFALCIGRNLLCAGRTKKRSEKRGAISPLIYSRIITAWTLSPKQGEILRLQQEEGFGCLMGCNSIQECFHLEMDIRSQTCQLNFPAKGQLTNDNENIPYDVFETKIKFKA